MMILIMAMLMVVMMTTTTMLMIPIMVTDYVDDGAGLSTTSQVAGKIF